MMARAIRLAVSLPLWLAALALFSMMVLTFFDVVARSMMDAPIPGAAEITEILLAGIVFLALPVTSLCDRHISVDLIDTFIPDAVLRWRDIGVNLVFGVLLWWPVAAGWKSAIRTLGYNEVTLYLRIPVGFIMLFISVGLAVGATAMILRSLLLAFRPQLLHAIDATSAT
ncbi:MAG: C4-dicarboxylate ABC transporter permease [Rhodobacteraceae bacterium]|nr:MAG: C4-dicarboxylate ABC transporter permease [Paracoccaceae bacterium]